MDSLFLEILPFLLIPIAIIGLIVYGLVRLIRVQVGKASINPNFKIAYSHEDFLGQVYVLVGYFFLWIALLAINRQIGSPVSSYSILLLLSVLGLVSSYLKRIILLLPLSLVGLVSWWVLQAQEWGSSMQIKSVTYLSISLFASLILYSLSFLHKKKFGFMRAYYTYTILGLVGGTTGLFYLSSESGFRSLQYITAGVAAFASWPIMLTIVVGLAAFISILVYSVGEGHVSLNRALFVGSLAILPAILLGLPQLQLIQGNDYYYSGPLFSILTTQGIWWYLITNALLFSEVVALILSGYAERETWRVNLGTIFLLIFLAIKYFDFFSLLSRSGFFIGTGLILSVMGFFMEKGRRKMILDKLSIPHDTN